MNTVNSTAVIEGFAALCATIHGAYRAGLPLFIYGSPGIGKTAAPIKVAADLGIEAMILDCVTMEASDFAGLPRGTSDGGAEFVAYGFARRMIETVEPLIVVIDELPSSPVDVQKAVMRLIYDRTIGGKRIADGVYFIGTGNSREDRAGSAGLLEPLKSRFTSLIRFQPLLSDWIANYAIPAGVDPLLIAFLSFRTAMFSAFEPRADYIQSPCPRNWASAARILAAQFDTRIEFAMLQGCIGPVAAAEFENMRRLLSEMPDPSVVLDGLWPEDFLVKIKTGTSGIAFTFAAALSRKVETEEHYRNGITFLKRINAEVFELFNMLAIRKLPALTDTSTYARVVTKTL